MAASSLLSLLLLDGRTDDIDDVVVVSVQDDILKTVLFRVTAILVVASFP